MMKRTLMMIAAVTCASAISPAVCAQEPTLAEQLDRAVLRAGLGQFWGAALVAREGEVLLARGYGYASEELDPVTADSLFDVGSVTKMFTAAAVLRLQADGRLSIGDPVSRFFPDSAAAAGSITLRHLLTHTSGKTDQRAIQPLTFDDRDEAVRLFIESAPNAAPGERFEYCNAGYVVLAAVIENASGQTYEQYVRANVLIPAGMSGSGFLDGAGLDASRQTLRVTQMGGPPGRGRRGLLLDKSVEPWAWGLKGAGGLVTSLNDLLRWDRAIAGGTLLDDEAMSAWLTPFKSNYAMGWMVREDESGRVVHSHGGSTRGYMCELRRYPNEGVVIAVLTNENGRTLFPGTVADALAQTLWPEPPAHIAATLDFSGPGLTQWKSIVLSGKEAAWSVSTSREGEIALACLRADGSGAPLRVMMNAVAAQRLARSIERTLKSPEHAAASDGGFECGIYGYMYGVSESKTAVSMKDGLAFDVMPMYRGRDTDARPIHDPRITIVMLDANLPGGRPVMLKADDAEARRLAKTLMDAAQQ